MPCTESISSSASAGSTFFPFCALTALINERKKTTKRRHTIACQASYINAKNSKYILLNAPNDKVEQIGNILPVLKSLTVLPLALEGWSSIHSVIDEQRFWEVIDELKAAGAEDILVCPIEKMVL